MPRPGFSGWWKNALRKIILLVLCSALNVLCILHPFIHYCCTWVQVVPLIMKAIGWQGGSILALETLKRVVVAGNRARDALVAQGLK